MLIKTGKDNALGLDVETDINALVISESYEFGRRMRNGDYRDRALARVIGLSVEFQSTGNNFWNMAKSMLKVMCPYCQSEMAFATNQSGSSDAMTAAYVCSCTARVSLRMPHEGISVTPPRPTVNKP